MAEARQVRADADGAGGHERQREALLVGAAEGGRDGAAAAEALDAEAVVPADDAVELPPRAEAVRRPDGLRRDELPQPLVVGVVQVQVLEALGRVGRVGPLDLEALADLLGDAEPGAGVGGEVDDGELAREGVVDGGLEDGVLEGSERPGVVGDVVRHHHHAPALGRLGRAERPLPHDHADVVGPRRPGHGRQPAGVRAVAGVRRRERQLGGGEEGLGGGLLEAWNLDAAKVRAPELLQAGLEERREVVHVGGAQALGRQPLALEGLERRVHLEDRAPGEGGRRPARAQRLVDEPAAVRGAGLAVDLDVVLRGLEPRGARDADPPRAAAGRGHAELPGGDVHLPQLGRVLAGDLGRRPPQGLGDGGVASVGGELGGEHREVDVDPVGAAGAALVVELGALQLLEGRGQEGLQAADDGGGEGAGLRGGRHGEGEHRVDPPDDAPQEHPADVAGALADLLGRHVQVPLAVARPAVQGLAVLELGELQQGRDGGLDVPVALGPLVGQVRGRAAVEEEAPAARVGRPGPQDANDVDPEPLQALRLGVDAGSDGEGHPGPVLPLGREGLSVAVAAARAGRRELAAAGHELPAELGRLGREADGIRVAAHQREVERVAVLAGGRAGALQGGLEHGRQLGKRREDPHRPRADLGRGRALVPPRGHVGRGAAGVGERLQPQRARDERGGVGPPDVGLQGVELHVAVGVVEQHGEGLVDRCLGVRELGDPLLYGGLQDGLLEPGV